MLTIPGIHALLTHCPRLTHLSLTGVHAFLRDELTEYCREAPLGEHAYLLQIAADFPEFTDHQRDVFCVFSGPGVVALRDHFNRRAYQNEMDGYGEYAADGEAEAEADDDGQASADATVTEAEQQMAGLMGATPAAAAGDDMDEEFGEDTSGLD